MKNYYDQGGCYPQRPKAEVDNTLRDLQNSSYPTKFFSKEKLNVFRKRFRSSARKKDGTLSVYKIHLRVAIDRFLRSLLLNKPFSTISEPAFTETNKALDHLEKTREKQAALLT